LTQRCVLCCALHVAVWTGRQTHEEMHQMIKKLLLPCLQTAECALTVFAVGS